MSERPPEKPLVRLLASQENWIEGEAVRQLEKTAELPGIFLAVGLPELHPGKGIPIGAVFASEGILYPHLVGNDVGCGMGLWQTDLKRRKIKRDRWAERLSDLEGPWEEGAEPWLAAEGVTASADDLALGTIGGGNHFAELQQVEQVEEPEVLHELGLEADHLVLLVHSGSRGLGNGLLRSHVERYGASGLTEGSEEADRYLAQHDHALRWARANRALIAHRFLAALGAEGRRVLDRCHNRMARG
ncbi:MAG: RNA ligase RtcB family protein, partial [Candidatus Tectomicrobia bacterium]|nr:RNA ligase RtcB family protein [Candidatus Tectomicrobia bacterium]